MKLSEQEGVHQLVEISEADKQEEATEKDQPQAEKLKESKAHRVKVKEAKPKNKNKEVSKPNIIGRIICLLIGHRIGEKIQSKGKIHVYVCGRCNSLYATKS